MAPFPSQMQQRKVKFSPTKHLTNFTSEKGQKTLPDPSRQLTRALEACDLIKIIVLMQSRKCQEDMEGCAGLLCSPQPQRLGIHRLPQANSSAFQLNPCMFEAMEFFARS